MQLHVLCTYRIMSCSIFIVRIAGFVQPLLGNRCHGTAAVVGALAGRQARHLAWQWRLLLLQWRLWLLLPLLLLRCKRL